MEKAAGIQIERDVELSVLGLGFNQNAYTSKGIALTELFRVKTVLLTVESTEMNLVAERGGRGQNQDAMVEKVQQGIRVVLVAKV